MQSVYRLLLLFKTNTMRNSFLTAMCFCFLQFSANVFAQSFTLKPLVEHTAIELSVLKTSEQSLTSIEHIYLLKALNLTSEQLHVVVRASNVQCDINPNTQNRLDNVDVVQKLYTSSDKELDATTLLDFMLPPNNHHEFYLKLQNPPNALNRNNCTEVKAMDNGSKKYYSNTIIIESFIPNPADFR